MDLCDEVRAHCAQVAAAARWVRIDPGAPVEHGGTAGLDPALHLLDAAPEAVARYVLILDAINFGSGWFGTLRTEPAEDDLTAITRRLTEHARAAGEPWTAAQLRALDAAQVAEVLGQDPEHELMELYARALVDLGGWLGSRGALEAVEGEGRGSAARLAAALAADDDLKSFAAREGITIHTARFHLRTALARTGARTQAELVRLAVRLIRDFALAEPASRTPLA